MKKIINYGECACENLILALGYFDAVHKGHKAVLEKTVQLATEKGCIASALIFTGKKSKSDVFTLFERVLKLFKLGIKCVIVKELTAEFMKKDKLDFLDELSSLYNINSVVCGSDFTFGKNAEGNVQTLKSYFTSDRVIDLNLVENFGKKISTTNIKLELEKGNVKMVNELLGDNYFISGEVISGKKVGRSLNFPTANIKLEDNKFKVKQGVYLTFTIIDGKIYPSITNCGAQPTVDGKNYLTETYIHNFNGDLYGKILTVYFVDYIRDVFKFENVDMLKAQLEKDLRWII